MKPKPPPKYDWHPYAALFPMLDDEELQKLADDIRQNGQLYPIILDNDSRVVEGRNRLVACRLAGVEPEFEARDLDDSDALALVIGANINRRHLTDSQRADIAAKLANIQPGARKGNRNATKNEPADLPVCSDEAEPPVTQAAAAELLHVSERSVRSAAKVQRKGTPELQAAVQDGFVAVSKAAELADLPAVEQPAAVAAAKQPKPRRKTTAAPYDAPRPPREFDEDAAVRRLTQLVRDELGRWPGEHLSTAAHWLRAILNELKV